MEEKSFSLTPVINTKTKTMELEKYSEVLDACKKYVATIPNDLVIENADDLKAVKKFRAEIGNKKKDITSVRLQANNMYLGVFNEQTKTIETILNEKWTLLGEKVKEYTESQKEEEPVVVEQKVFKATISTTDEKAFNKVVELCEKNNIAVVIAK